MKQKLQYLIFFIFVDAQSFTNPTFGSNVNTYGNLSGSVDFSFTYTVPDNSKIGSLSCGYGGRNYIAQKRGTQPAGIQTGFVGRAEIITDITGSSLTIRLKNLNFNDAKPVSCLLVYDGLPYDSGRYNLNIYGKFNVFMFFYDKIQSHMKFCGKLGCWCRAPLPFSDHRLL